MARAPASPMRTKSKRRQGVRGGEVRHTGVDDASSKDDTSDDDNAVSAAECRSGRSARRERKGRSSALREQTGGRAAITSRHQETTSHSLDGRSRCSCGEAEGRLASAAVGDDVVGADSGTSIDACGVVRGVRSGIPACAVMAGDSDSVSKRIA
eukprot:5777758-Pleurochrysis_carterae.AAC.1